MISLIITILFCYFFPVFIIIFQSYLELLWKYTIYIILEWVFLIIWFIFIIQTSISIIELCYWHVNYSLYLIIFCVQDYTLFILLFLITKKYQKRFYNNNTLCK